MDLSVEPEEHDYEAETVTAYISGAGIIEYSKGEDPYEETASDFGEEFMYSETPILSTTSDLLEP